MFGWLRVRPLVAAAMVTLLPAIVAAAPTKEGVVLLEPEGGFRGLDRKALRRSFDIYLQAYETARDQAVPGGFDRDRALALAEQHGARFALWFDQQQAGGEYLLSAHLVDREAPDESELSFSVRQKTKPAPAFYRQVGLKLDSLLRVATMTATEGARDGAPRPAPATPLRRPDEPEPDEPQTAVDDAPPWPHGRPALQLIARGGLPVSPLRFVPAFGGQLRWDGYWWSAGAGVLHALDDERTADTGVGVASTTRLMASTGFRLVEPWGDVLAPWLMLEVGAMLISVDGQLAATGEWESTSDAVPFASVGALAGLHFGRHFAVFVGPTLDLAPRQAEVLVRGQEVYSSGWIQPNVELRIQGAL
ncbi:MAG: hypothetical protein JRI23_03350 [Deltaproteobacteria bacterium]|nr:hypothetical protein [Deltaproteobacteria bacterium]MBW2530546.1 hypothetical protein [Deltaproteobacteria bacterium]